LTSKLPSIRILDGHLHEPAVRFLTLLNCFFVCFPVSERCQEELVLRSHVANANDSISDYQH
jgi:hypothetical protein